jgi:CO dehydrogenase maturation factor
MPRVLATLGKGGVGKTTVAAMAVKALSAAGRRVLAIDADPSGGLGLALGLEAKRTVNDIRLEIIESIKNGGGNKQELVLSLDYHLLDALAERGGIAFLSVGRPEEEGCYCQLNTLLREAIEILSRGFDVTVVDAEAGIEQISRRVMRSVDTMILVSDTSLKGMKVASAIAEAAQEDGKIEALFLLNRVHPDEDPESISADWGRPIRGWLPEDEAVYSFDRDGRSFLDLPPCPAYEALDRVLRSLS